MSVDTAKQYLDEKIVKLSAEIEQAKSLRAALDDSQLVQHISGLIAGKNGKATPRKGAAPTDERTNFQQIVSFFEANENVWSATSDIISSTGLERGIVSNVLYVANLKDFESKDHPTMKRRKLWRLKAGA